MQRYFITLSYDGSKYHGWQIQPNGSSVQETLEKAISILLLDYCLIDYYVNLLPLLVQGAPMLVFMLV